MVEGALGAGRAATTAAPAKSMGKSMSGIAGSLDKALKGGESGKTSQTIAVPSSSQEPAATDKPGISIREDADGIEEGLPYEELIQRFGKPAMAITVDGEQALTYKGIAGSYRVIVRNGKVRQVTPPRSL